MSDHVLNVNTILHTKDGRRIGNAIVTGRKGLFWYIKTDYGSEKWFTSEEIDELFYIGWSDLSKEIDGMSCDEMQRMISETHKYRIWQ